MTEEAESATDAPDAGGVPVPAAAAEAVAQEPPTPGPPTPVSSDATEVPYAPVPSAFARLSTEPRSVLGASLDLLTRSAAELRRASLYLGVLVLGTVGPLVMLLWAAAATDVDIGRIFRRNIGVTGWISAAELLAVIGFLVATIESRGAGAALLGARLQDRPLSVQQAVRRSRMSFWRLVGLLVVVSVPLLILQAVLDARLAELFRGRIDVSDLIATLVVAVVATPLAYATTGVVLGDVGVFESARRSVRLFRARKRSALVVSLLAVIAQLLTTFGLLAALDLVARVFETFRLDPASGLSSIAVITVILIAVTFAGGSLLFTVNAIALAPQVVMFAALTHVAPGLDTVRTDDMSGWLVRERPFRWITFPLVGGFILGAIVLVGGLSALLR